MSEDRNRQQVVHVQSEKFQSLYTNNANIQISYFDFRFEFRQLMPGADGGIVVERMASVVMSPQHAKAFLGVLAENIRQYEEQFGAIKMERPVEH